MSNIDKTAINKSVVSQSSAIEIPLDYIKMAANKSDDLKPWKLSQNSADDAKGCEK